MWPCSVVVLDQPIHPYPDYTWLVSPNVRNFVALRLDRGAQSNIDSLCVNCAHEVRALDPVIDTPVKPEHRVAGRQGGWSREDNRRVARNDGGDDNGMTKGKIATTRHIESVPL